MSIEKWIHEKWICWNWQLYTAYKPEFIANCAISQFVSEGKYIYGLIMYEYDIVLYHTCTLTSLFITHSGIEETARDCVKQVASLSPGSVG